MVVDAVLWAIFAAMIVLIACGCILTRPTTKQPPGRPRGTLH
jgi:hypothetical protein